MRLLYKYLIIAGLFLQSCAIANALTFRWELPPSDYSGLERIGPDLFLAHKNGKTGLIDSRGNQIAPFENDALGQFYGGYALLTRQDGRGERISGFVSENGKYLPVSGNYYTLNGQKFVSDGVISVADASGKPGYIDVNGNEIVGFNGKFDRVKPFTEGYAVVSKNKKFYLIDKSGTPVRFMFDGVGEVFGITNPFNGIVWLWDTDGRFYNYDINKGGTCKRAKLRGDNKSIDYLYRFSQISGQGKNVPFKKMSYQGVAGPQPVISGNLYGYAEDGVTVIPPQFGKAQPFMDGLAVASTGGRFGILRILSDTGVNVSSGASSTLNFHDGESVKCPIYVSIPSSFRNSEVRIEVKDECGNLIPVILSGSTSHFNYRPTTTGKINFNTIVTVDGLTMPSSDLDYSFRRKVRCRICGRDTDVCPGHVAAPKNDGQKHKTTPNQNKGVKICPTCGKKISECAYQGVH